MKSKKWKKNKNKMKNKPISIHFINKTSKPKYTLSLMFKDLMTNTIGKRVMKTQDLKDITK